MPQTSLSRNIAQRVARDIKGVLPFNLVKHPNGILGKVSGDIIENVVFYICVFF